MNRAAEMFDSIMEQAQELRNIISLTKTKLIYVGQPYSSNNPVEQYERLYLGAEYINRHLQNDANEVYYSPICHCYTIKHTHDLSGTWEFWRNHDMSMLSLCDEMHALVLPGWAKSIGLTAELDFCVANDITRRYFSYDRKTDDFVEVELPNTDE